MSVLIPAHTDTDTDGTHGHAAEPSAKPSPSACTPAPQSPSPAPLTDLLMLHHGLAHSGELLAGHRRAGAGQRPMDLPWPRPLRFLHTFYPAQAPLLGVIPGYDRYDYQQQRLVPGVLEGGAGRAAGLLVNQVDLPPGGVPVGQGLLSFSSFFVRFKPFADDGARGLATLRLPNLRIRLDKRLYRLVPGSAAAQFVGPEANVSTGLWLDWSALLYVRLSRPNPLALPPQPPAWLPPDRLPINQQPDRALMLRQELQLSPYHQSPFSTELRWRDIHSDGQLSFVYEAGTELLIEVGLYTWVLPTAIDRGLTGHGLVLGARTQVDALHIDTVRYA